jgi:photosystem II stability/assembly factor-like uncharacterized protein
VTAAAGRPQARPACAIFAAVVLLAAAAPGAAQDTDGESSLIKPLASRSLLLDAAAAGNLMVTVGERGHVLVSHDQGASWQQQSVPTRATLTAVFLHDENLGWVVGHDAVILRTRDGGTTWQKLHSAPEEERPLLDVWFKDADTGFAVGAYGYFLATADGGDTWVDRSIVDLPIDETDPYATEEGADFHLNHIARSDSGRLYIAAEAGVVYASDDDGETWTELPSPYAGSFFASLPLAGDSLLLFGLRGHLFRSDDAGASWQPIETGTQAMLTDGARLADGTIAIAGLAGVVLVSHDGGASFELAQQADRQGLAAILPTDDGHLLLVGEYGVHRLSAGALAREKTP